MSLRKIILSDVREIDFVIATERLSYEEPIPPFETRFSHKLESCLWTPFQRFNKKDLYPGLIKKAAILLYLLISNHPFLNGNKRIAFVVLLHFLSKNGKYIDVDPIIFYNFTVWVAQSPSELKEQVVSGIELFLKTHLISLKE
ncbi:MAG: type II toxin-antitoxin system death-on-curing family toxin [Candidatus Parcubacteria bacterium]|nr:type II toxin-antitoxin system death-on-curing family toxin [Candidatus Parcubacteria bacterium]